MKRNFLKSDSEMLNQMETDMKNGKNVTLKLNIKLQNINLIMK